MDARSGDVDGAALDVAGCVGKAVAADSLGGPLDGGGNDGGGIDGGGIKGGSIDGGGIDAMQTDADGRGIAGGGMVDAAATAAAVVCSEGSLERRGVDGGGGIVTRRPRCSVYTVFPIVFAYYFQISITLRDLVHGRRRNASDRARPARGQHWHQRAASFPEHFRSSSELHSLRTSPKYTCPVSDRRSDAWDCGAVG